STTPVAPGSLLAAQLVVNVLALLLASVLAYIAAVVAFHVRPPTNVPGLAASFVLGSAAMCAVALLIAAVTPSTPASSAPGTAVGVGQAVLLPVVVRGGGVAPGPAQAGGGTRGRGFPPVGRRVAGDAGVGGGGVPSGAAPGREGGDHGRLCRRRFPPVPLV